MRHSDAALNQVSKGSGKAVAPKYTETTLLRARASSLPRYFERKARDLDILEMDFDFYTRYFLIAGLAEQLRSKTSMRILDARGAGGLACYLEVIGG